MSTERYTGSGRRGTNRPMTDAEKTTWTQTAATWHNDPPWTDQARADNAAVQNLLVTLFEDGVSLKDLAETANWGKAKVSGIRHRASARGIGTGTRRYIAPEPTERQVAKASKAPFRRALTDAETSDLTRLYGSLPRYASGRGWKTPEGAELTDLIAALAADDVALETIGETLGMSRQAIHLRLNAKRAQTASDAA